MAKFEIDRNNSTILFEGNKFKLKEIKEILIRNHAKLFSTISCPGEIKYVLSEEAKQIMREIALKKK